MADDLKARLQRYIVTDGRNFKLKNRATSGDEMKLSPKQTREVMEEGIKRLGQLQEKLYAQDSHGVLLIFQAMDAAGKDGAVKHVMSGINPQGCQVYSFKSPSAEELDHDFLWRTTKALPERGRIGIFNRSYYEETLVVRVHPEYLQKQKLPPDVLSKNIWRERFEDINAFERYLSRNGYVIRKFFLNVSKKEQKKRFLDRIERGEKNWKFSMADAKERGHWDEYMDAYQDMIRNTATRHAPWIVVPADNKRLARLIVAGVVIDALQDLKLKFPKVSDAQKADLEAAKQALEAEKRV
jgi:PPK2 family polyphosphate:nucleotide phosphotransferase